MRNLIDELEIEKAHADSMSAMARHWMARAQQAEKEIVSITAILVEAAGGRITVFPEVLHRLPRLTVEKMACPEDMSVRYRTTIRD